MKLSIKLLIFATATFLSSTAQCDNQPRRLLRRHDIDEQSVVPDLAASSIEVGIDQIPVVPADDSREVSELEREKKVVADEKEPALDLTITENLPTSTNVDIKSIGDISDAHEDTKVLDSENIDDKDAAAKETEKPPRQSVTEHQDSVVPKSHLVDPLQTSVLLENEVKAAHVAGDVAALSSLQDHRNTPFASAQTAPLVFICTIGGIMIAVMAFAVLVVSRQGYNDGQQPGSILEAGQTIDADGNTVQTTNEEAEEDEDVDDGDNVITVAFDRRTSTAVEIDEGQENQQDEAATTTTYEEGSI